MTTTTALIIIDVQEGFSDSTWGATNNPAAEANIALLLDGWHAAGQPVVLVRHDSRTPGSPLAPGSPGNTFAAILDGVEPTLVFGKSVNSAFHGEIDLHAWLARRGIDAIVLAGIQTNMCVETTARVGGNLGHNVTVALDATRTFDLAGPDGSTLTADELTRATGTNLHGGGFAKIATTRDLLADLTPPSADGTSRGSTGPAERHAAALPHMAMASGASQVSLGQASRCGTRSYDLLVFVVTLTYLVDLPEVDAALPEHVAWLDQQYADGVFIASGRQVPRVGGLILATGTSRQDLDRRLALDPFGRLGLAEHTVVEFAPSRVAQGLEQLLP